MQIQHCPQLLVPTPESAYWLGVLLTDGTINEKGRIRLGSVDRELVEAFHAWSGSKSVRSEIAASGSTFWTTNLQTAEGRELVQMGVLAPGKTYDPPSFEALWQWMNREGFWRPLIVGCVDGDGYINDKYITIRSHKAWAQFYRQLFTEADISYSSTIHKDGFTISTGGRTWRRQLADVAKTLPFTLRRKWDVADVATATESQMERATRLRPIIRRLYQEGSGVGKIADLLDMSQTRVIHCLRGDEFYELTKQGTGNGYRKRLLLE